MTRTAETPLQREVREMGIANLAAQRAAEKSCKTWDEVDQCRAAYSQVYWDRVDVIQQRHGLAPLLRFDSRVVAEAQRYAIPYHPFYSDCKT